MALVQDYFAGDDDRYFIDLVIESPWIAAQQQVEVEAALEEVEEVEPEGSEDVEPEVLEAVSEDVEVEAEKEVVIEAQNEVALPCRSLQPLDQLLLDTFGDWSSDEDEDTLMLSDEQKDAPYIEVSTVPSDYASPAVRLVERMNMFSRRVRGTFTQTSTGISPSSTLVVTKRGRSSQTDSPGSQENTLQEILAELQALRRDQRQIYEETTATIINM